MNPTATSRAAGTPSHQAILRGSSRTWQKLKPLQLIGITLNPGLAVPAQHVLAH